MEMWLLLAIVAVLLVGIVVPLWRTIRQDGLGHRTPAASRSDWSERSELLT